MRKTQHAFTFIELLVTLSVVAIVISIAAPSFNQLIANNRSDTLGDNFASRISLARYEAIKRSTRVSVCASSDGATCGTDWTKGFITFVDKAADAAAAPDISGAPIQYWNNPDSSAVITVLRDGADVAFFRFTSLGTLARIDDKPVLITTSTKGCVGTNHAQLITIGLAGIVSVTGKQLCP